MQVTNINLFKSNFANQSVVKAFGSVELDNVLMLDIEVCDKGGEGEQWFRFPMSKKVKDKNTGEDKWLNRVYVKDKDILNKIKNEIVSKYNREIKYGSGPENTQTTNGNQEERTAEFPF